MMPKGVEHLRLSPTANSLIPVRIPMMPKGVEHTLTLLILLQSVYVRIPMMPKGVEHRQYRANYYSTHSENSDDAERR